MKETISKFINEFHSLEIQPEGINDQFKWYVQKTKELIQYLNAVKVNEFYVSKFEYIEHLTNQMDRNEINHIKHYELNLKRRDVIELLSDKSLRSYYLGFD
jgi:5'-deoxynucleotidase YfbR-like HD superfamily hydrolase